MIYDGYERLRERLEEQLRADIELLQEAHRVRLRALETVAHARGEVAGRPAAAAEAPPALPPPAQAPAPAVKAPLRRSRAYALHDAVEDALAKMGETFDKGDLCAVLGFEPNRASLYRVLGDLMHERKIEIAAPASGHQPSRYRKLAAALPSGDAAGQS